MKKGNITRFKLNPKRRPKTDWRAFDAMSKEERHRAALSDPDCPPATKAQLARARRVPTVRALRKKLNRTQTREQRTELRSLAALPDGAIDTSDAPGLLDWSGAKRGLFYRPVKQQLTLRLDADVVAWFKRHTTSGEGYQTRINRALREYVQEQASKGRRSRA
jgi:uncharacterized protein (DUF4415 family)